MNSLTPEWAAARLLSKQSSIGHGLWVKDLRFDMRIIFDTFDHYCSVCDDDGVLPCEGCTVETEGLTLVLYNHGWDIGRINYTLAHELGHILLGHVGKDADESEANRFASALVIPFAPLRALGKVGVKEVADFFGCSVSAAGFALKRTDVVTPYDDQILSLFEERISSYKRKRNPLDILWDL